MDEAALRQLIRRELGNLPELVRQLQGVSRARVTPTWLPLSYFTGWSSYPGGYTAGYSVSPSGWVTLRGMIVKSTAWVAGEGLFTMPVGAQPGSLRPFGTHANTTAGWGHAVVQPNSGGGVQLRAVGPWISAADSFIGLDGISYWAEG